MRNTFVGSACSARPPHSRDLHLLTSNAEARIDCNCRCVSSAAVITTQHLDEWLTPQTSAMSAIVPSTLSSQQFQCTGLDLIAAGRDQMSSSGTCQRGAPSSLTLHGLPLLVM